MNTVTRPNINTYGSELQDMDIRSRVNPDIFIDTTSSIKTDFNILNEVNPEIHITGGEYQNFRIYTDVSPKIRLNQQQKSGSPASDFDFEDCFFNKCD